MVNIKMWKHPKYYKELRKRNKLAESRQPVVGGQQQSDQAISEATGTPTQQSVRPGPGLKLRHGGLTPEASGAKHQASSFKLSNQPVQAASDKHQVLSSKHQASSHKQQAPIS